MPEEIITGAQVEEEQEKVPESPNQKKPKKVRKLKGINAPDMKYRGPLHYQHLRILGWLFFALSAFSFILTAIAKAGPNPPSISPTLIQILESLRDLMAPLFLLANFSLILAARGSYKKFLILYGALTLLIIAAFFIYGERLLVIISNLLGEKPEDRKAIRDAFATGFLYAGFNIFLDLFLCTLFAFFLNYQPKKLFQGKKICIFRCFAILVALYEAIAIVIKILTIRGYILLPLEVTPFLTTKPIMTFLAFITIALFIKFRERHFVKHYGTHDDYTRYLATNANSFHVGAMFGVTFLIAAVLDLILAVACLVVMVPGESEADMAQAVGMLNRIGIGSAIPLALVAPVCFLLSYTRVPKFAKLDKFIPIGGLLIGVLLVIEGVLYILGHLG